VRVVLETVIIFCLVSGIYRYNIYLFSKISQVILLTTRTKLSPYYQQKSQKTFLCVGKIFGFLQIPTDFWNYGSIKVYTKKLKKSCQQTPPYQTGWDQCQDCWKLVDKIDIKLFKLYQKIGFLWIKLKLLWVVWLLVVLWL
jgi:hypothetical protein